MAQQSIEGFTSEPLPQKDVLEERARLAWAEVAKVRAQLDVVSWRLEHVAYKWEESSDGELVNAGLRSGKGAGTAKYKLRAQVADLRQELRTREKDYKDASEAFLATLETNPFKLKPLREEWEERWEAWHDAEQAKAKRRREKAQERFEAREPQREAEAGGDRPSSDDEPLPQRTTLDYEAFLANEFGVEKVGKPNASGDVLIRCLFPDHSDSTPSFSMSVTTRGYWGSCFGCGRGFNAVTLLRDVRKIESSEERRRIVQSYGGDPGDSGWRESYEKKHPDRDNLGRPRETMVERRLRLSDLLNRQLEPHLPVKPSVSVKLIASLSGKSIETARDYQREWLEKGLIRVREGMVERVPATERFLEGEPLSVTNGHLLTSKKEREGREEKESFGAEAGSQDQSLTTTGFETSSTSSSPSEKKPEIALSVTCEGCGKPIEGAKRSSRRHCGVTCRKRAQRLRAASSMKKPESAYPYVDESGDWLYRIVRNPTWTDTPSVAQRWDGRGWVTGVKGVRRVLYRLPYVLDAVAHGGTVYLHEGEKAADAMMEAYGVTATSAPFGGSAKPTEELVEPLRGADVVLFADRDETGRKWASNWLEALSGVARSVTLVASATLDEKDDAVEHIEAGYGLDDLIPVEPEDLIVVAATHKTQERCDVFPTMPPLDPKEPVEPWFNEWRTRHLAAALEQARRERATA